MSDQHTSPTPECMTTHERQIYQAALTLEKAMRAQQKKQRETLATLETERVRNLLALLKSAKLFWADLGWLETELKRITARIEEQTSRLAPGTPEAPDAAR